MYFILIITIAVLLGFLLLVLKVKSDAKKQGEILKKYSSAFEHLIKLGFFKQDEIESIIKHEISHTNEDKMFEKFNVFKARIEYLISKYGIEKARIYYDKTYWIGMSKDELIDSLGNPIKVLNKETSKSKIESYYYDFTVYNFNVTPYKSSNFKLKFVISNDIVTEFSNMQRI
ncbi:MAG: hypothetical protein V4620_15180 [Bacteroidota bacterium]